MGDNDFDETVADIVRLPKSSQCQITWAEYPYTVNDLQKELVKNAVLYDMGALLDALDRYPAEDIQRAHAGAKLCSDLLVLPESTPTTLCPAKRAKLSAPPPSFRTLPSTFFHAGCLPSLLALF